MMKKYKLNKRAQMTAMTWIIAIILIFFMSVVYLFFVGALMPKIGQTQQSIIAEFTGGEDLFTLYNLRYYIDNNLNKEGENLTKNCGQGLIDSKESFNKDFVTPINGDIYSSVYLRKAFLVSIDNSNIKTYKYWRGDKC